MNDQPQNDGRPDLASVRVDLGLFRMCEGVVKRAAPQVPLWEHGVGDVVREFFYQNGLPRGPITVVDLARRAGLLRKVGKVT
jgi:hypothetical protein